MAPYDWADIKSIRSDSRSQRTWTNTELYFETFILISNLALLISVGVDCIIRRNNDTICSRVAIRSDKFVR